MKTINRTPGPGVFVLRWTSLTLLLAALCLLPALHQTAQAQEVTGHTVQMLEFGFADGLQLGTIIKTDRKAWIVQNERGQEIFTLREIGRDAQSVSLRDAADNVALLLDLEAMRVMYSDKKSPTPQALYTILFASEIVGDRLANTAAHDQN